MIYYYFIKENKDIKEIKIFGHASYNKKNYDIVCSSVSTAIILTLNALKILKLNKNFHYVLKDGFLKIKILKKNYLLSSLLKNLEYSLEELEKNFKKYIQKIEIKKR